jgi:hypothetical protein
MSKNVSSVATDPKNLSRYLEGRLTIMPDKTQNKNGWKSRDILALGILVFSVVVLGALGITAIAVKKEDTLTILNIILPVVASWVGTILAFYFGRENFESANMQVRELIQQFTPEERAKSLVKDAMRGLSDTVHFKIPESKTDKDVKIKQLREKYGGKVSRLPIVNPDDSPRYMLHESRIIGYLEARGDEEQTLDHFIADQKNRGFEYGLNKGFVVVSEATTVAAAKTKMEQFPSCQDVFVTKGGKDNEPLTGWISNVRLTQFLHG